MSDHAADTDADTGSEHHPPLVAETIAAAIDDLGGGGTGRIGSHIEVIAETASTNDLALAAGRNGAEEGWVVFAECQTAGRGRRGDPWLSPPRRDLLFSLLLRPDAETSAWPRLPQLAAVALCRAIDHLAPALRVEARIKWPNDIWLGDRKVSGLLVDTNLQSDAPFAVLGIGLNVNSVDFGGELAETATSLCLEAGRKGVSFDRNWLAARVLVELGRLYPRGLDDEGFVEVREALHRRSCLLGRRVNVDSASGQLSGTVSGFGEHGEMVLRDANGVDHTLHSAVSVRPSSK